MHDFTHIKGYDPDLINIPEEFEDLPIADLKPKDFARKSSNKKLIRARSSKNMTNYDAWRCHDRSVFTTGVKHPNAAKFLIPPSLLRKAFGIPDQPGYAVVSTGEYNFEDNNLDCYKLFDYKQTDFYHGINREDDYYTSAKNLRKPFHKRKRKMPTVEQFWNSEESFEFRLTADEKADVGRFKRWFRAQLRAAMLAEKSHDEMVLEKYGPKIDICLGAWDEPGVINRDFAVHKLDANQFMTKQEIKEYPFEKVKPIVPPKMFDLSKASRVTMSKEQLNQIKEEKEAKQRAATI